MYIQTVIKNYGVFATKRGTRRFLNRAVKAGLQFALEYWHGHILPKHFDNPQALNVRYPGVYRKRTAKYQRRKARQKGHTRLLVWSGETEESILGRYTLSGSAKRATIKVYHPIKRRKNKAGQWRSVRLDNIDKELTATSRKDDIEMSRVLDRFMRDQLAKYDGFEDVEVFRAA